MRLNFLALILFLVCVPAVVMAVPAIVAEGGYVRETIPGRTVSVAFLTLHNNRGEACELVAVDSPQARSVEVHQHLHINGKMQMRPVPSFVIPAHQSVELQPGGYHLMLFALQAPLKKGAVAEFSLDFGGCGVVSVSLPVVGIDKY